MVPPLALWCGWRGGGGSSSSSNNNLLIVPEVEVVSPIKTPLYNAQHITL